MVGDLRSSADNVVQSSDSPAGKITNDDGDDTIDETPPDGVFCIVFVLERLFESFVFATG